jgi:manganese-dependent inorganic pyrophosphatase
MTAASLKPQPGVPVPTYVVGHKNPDADSICSAIAYAAFKEARGETGYIAARCGNSNARIDAILERFHTPLPLYLSDVSPRVHDVMAANPHSVPETATCAEALEFIDRHGHRLVPVLDSNRRVVGIVTTGQLAHAFLPQINEPKKMRQVSTAVDSIARTLHARIVHVAPNATEVEELFVRIGAMDIQSFWKITQREGIPADKSIIVVGDRRDIQLKSIELGVRLLVITGNLPVDDDIVAAARAKGIGLLVSPYDTATTAWLIRTAGRLAPLIDRSFTAVDGDARLADVRRKLGASSAPAFMATS